MHFRSYPRDALQPLEGDGVQASYFNSLKEAAYVLTGSSSSVMTLTKASQQELWQNVLEAKDEDFFSNLSKMDLTRPTVSHQPCLSPLIHLCPCSNSDDALPFVTRPTT